MVRYGKKIIIIVGGLAALLVLAAAALLLLIDIDGERPRLEAAATGALGLEVALEGPVGVALLPSFHIRLEDVRIRNGDDELLSVDEVRIDLELLPLLRRDLRINRVVLVRPVFSVERRGDGTFNFERPGEEGEEAAPVELARLSLVDATFSYSDGEGGQVRAEGCDLDLRDLLLAGGGGVGVVERLSVVAELSCDVARVGGIDTHGWELAATVVDGDIAIDPFAMSIFGARGSGALYADLSSGRSAYRLHLDLPRFRVEEFFAAFSPEVAATGLADLSIDIEAQGTALAPIRRSLRGDLALRGAGITIEGRDLDEALDRYEASQSFNLVDAGAFFFIGPLGVVVTKGYDFAGIFRGTGGRSELRALVAEWQLSDGVARAHDVALSTSRHRIALKGGLDLTNERFDGLVVALVDAGGCSTVEQKIKGSFSDPVVDQPGVLRTIAGPLVRLLQRGGELMSGEGGECEVFYAGEVASPR